MLDFVYCVYILRFYYHILSIAGAYFNLIIILVMSIVNTVLTYYTQKADYLLYFILYNIIEVRLS